MTFRARLLTGFLAAAVLPLAVLAVGVRREMHTRVTAQDERRAQDLATVVASDFAELHASVGAALSRISGALPDDARFRAELLRGESGDRGYLIDYAGAAMRSAGLSMLQIRDESGLILSSGHFPAEYDRIDPGLPRALRSATGATLVSVRTADGVLTAAARLDSVTIGGRKLTIIGGRDVNQPFIDRLARGAEIGVDLALPGGTLRSRAMTANATPTPASTNAAESNAETTGDVLRRLEVPYFDATTTPITQGSAALMVVRRQDAGLALRRSIDRWIIAAVLVATVTALLGAFWLAARLSRPMEALAAATAAVDLDRLDVRFASARDDEIGVLARRLAALVERLRSSTARLREAERRATVGEIARQVNHDIKNGLAPIRNVVRHLAQVARDEPAELPSIFTARQSTLESSIAYLETLARNYARLSPSLAVKPTDVGPVIAEVARAAARDTVAVRASVAPGLPPVLADAVVVRRILENLVDNAIDSLEGKAGNVTITAERAAAQPLVRLTVEDTGRGMTEPELGRAFDDFHTTKPQGTGLGLSVVRRLVGDLGGALRIETEPGVGTRVQVDFPIAPAVPAASGAAGGVRTTLTPTR